MEILTAARAIQIAESIEDENRWTGKIISYLRKRDYGLALVTCGEAILALLHGSQSESALDFANRKTLRRKFEELESLISEVRETSVLEPARYRRKPASWDRWRFI